jgi:hypothetical protein
MSKKKASGKSRQGMPLQELARELHAAQTTPNTSQQHYDKLSAHAIGRALLNQESISELITFLNGRLNTNPRQPFLPYIRERTIRANDIDADQLLDTYRLSEDGELSRQPYTCRVKGLVYRGGEGYIALNLKDDKHLAGEMSHLRQQISKNTCLPLDVVLAGCREPREVVSKVVEEATFLAPIPFAVELGELAVRNHPRDPS